MNFPWILTSHLIIVWFPTCFGLNTHFMVSILLILRHSNKYDGLMKYFTSYLFSLFGFPSHSLTLYENLIHNQSLWFLSFFVFNLSTKQQLRFKNFMRIQRARAVNKKFLTSLGVVLFFSLTLDVNDFFLISVFSYTFCKHVISAWLFVCSGRQKDVRQGGESKWE